jgi:NADH:ubiquinone oxidoreductase subunit E
MPIQLTLCRLCTRSRPEFRHTITQLASAYPDQLLVEELECMAACDDVPAVMIETDYYPQVPSCELIRLVEARLSELLRPVEG